jgi:hypothetical protein
MFGVVWIDSEWFGYAWKYLGSSGEVNCDGRN